MKLTHSIEQTDKYGKDESRMTICVDYDPSEREVIGIEYVEVYNIRKNVTTDITSIMADGFGSELDSMVERIDWWHEYRTTKDSKAA